MRELSEFENLNWSEADLLRIEYSGSSLELEMTDLFESDSKLKYEIVEVSINGITDISLTFRPFNNNEYGPNTNILSIGEDADIDTFNVFEAITMKNAFNMPEAEHYWVECWFRASDIHIHRTGKYIVK